MATNPSMNKTFDKADNKNLVEHFDQKSQLESSTRVSEEEVLFLYPELQRLRPIFPEIAKKHLSYFQKNQDKEESLDQKAVLEFNEIERYINLIDAIEDLIDIQMQNQSEMLQNALKSKRIRIGIIQNYYHNHGLEIEQKTAREVIRNFIFELNSSIQALLDEFQPLNFEFADGYSFEFFLSNCLANDVSASEISEFMKIPKINNLRIQMAFMLITNNIERKRIEELAENSYLTNAILGDFNDENALILYLIQHLPMEPTKSRISLELIKKALETSPRQLEKVVELHQLGLSPIVISECIDKHLTNLYTNKGIAALLEAGFTTEELKVEHSDVHLNENAAIIFAKAGLKKDKIQKIFKLKLHLNGIKLNDIPLLLTVFKIDELPLCTGYSYFINNALAEQISLSNIYEWTKHNLWGRLNGKGYSYVIPQLLKIDLTATEVEAILDHPLQIKLLLDNDLKLPKEIILKIVFKDPKINADFNSNSNFTQNAYIAIKQLLIQLSLNETIEFLTKILPTLNTAQIKGLSHNMSIKEVQDPRLTEDLIALIETRYYSWNQIAHLHPVQIRTLIHFGANHNEPEAMALQRNPSAVTLLQIDQSWWTPLHSLGLERGLSYQIIAEKTAEQLMEIFEQESANLMDKKPVLALSASTEVQPKSEELSKGYTKRIHDFSVNTPVNVSINTSPNVTSPFTEKLDKLIPQIEKMERDRKDRYEESAKLLNITADSKEQLDNIEDPGASDAIKEPLQDLRLIQYQFVNGPGTHLTFGQVRDQALALNISAKKILALMEVLLQADCPPCSSNQALFILQHNIPPKKAFECCRAGINHIGTLLTHCPDDEWLVIFILKNLVRIPSTQHWQIFVTQKSTIKKLLEEGLPTETVTRILNKICEYNNYLDYRLLPIVLENVIFFKRGISIEEFITLEGRAREKGYISVNFLGGKHFQSNGIEPISLSYQKSVLSQGASLQDCLELTQLFPSELHYFDGLARCLKFLSPADLLELSKDWGGFYFLKQTSALPHFPISEILKCIKLNLHGKMSVDEIKKLFEKGLNLQELISLMDRPLQLSLLLDDELKLSKDLVINLKFAPSLPLHQYHRGYSETQTAINIIKSIFKNSSPEEGIRVITQILPQFIPYQWKGLIKGIDLKVLTDQRCSELHMNVMLRLNVAWNDIAHLKIAQLRTLNTALPKLSPKEVDVDWWTPMHSIAMDLGFGYKEIAEKDAKALWELMSTPCQKRVEPLLMSNFGRRVSHHEIILKAEETDPIISAALSSSNLV